jgi:hypothetical protein
MTPTASYGQQQQGGPPFGSGPAAAAAPTPLPQAPPPPAGPPANVSVKNVDTSKVRALSCVGSLQLLLLLPLQCAGRLHALHSMNCLICHYPTK